MHLVYTKAADDDLYNKIYNEILHISFMRYTIFHCYHKCNDCFRKELYTIVIKVLNDGDIEFKSLLISYLNICGRVIIVLNIIYGVKRILNNICNYDTVNFM